ncbi:MATE family efflux transporter [Spirochaetia bacterium]|nr:MATE family efflux transporter [Spirochaetia bacterium]
MIATVSRALGEKDADKIYEHSTAAIFLSCLGFLLCLVLSRIIIGFYYNAQKNMADVIGYGKTYLSISMELSFGIFGQVLFERFLIATGKTIYSMITQATGAIINIILDPILIFGYFGFPELGIAGAAIATVTGQTAAFILALLFNLAKNKEIRIRFSVKVKFSAIKRILLVGIPTTLMSVVTSIMFIGYNTILGKFSSTAVAVFGICRSVTTFFYMLVRAFGSTLIPIIAYNFGTKNKERIISGIKLGFIYNCFIMIIGTILFETATVPILHLFNASDEMMSIGIIGIRMLTATFILAGIQNTASAIMQSLAYAVNSMVIITVRNLVLLLPAAYLFSLTNNLTLVWFSVPVADGVASVVAIVLLLKVFNKEIKPLKNNV